MKWTSTLTKKKKLGYLLRQSFQTCFSIVQHSTSLSLIPQNCHWVINVFTYIDLKLEDWRLILRQGFFSLELKTLVEQYNFFPTCTFVRSKRRQFCNRHDEKFKLLSLLRFICRRLYQNYQLNNCFGLILRKDKWKAFFGLEISAASSFSGDSLCN